MSLDWEKKGVPGQNPHKHSEDMQTSPSEDLKQNLFAVMWQYNPLHHYATWTWHEWKQMQSSHPVDSEAR